MKLPVTRTTLNRDYLLPCVWIAVFIALIVSPDKWGFRLLLFSFAAMGMWCLLYRQGVIGWVPQLDPNDRSLWWIPRLIGGGFLLMVVHALVLFWR